MIARTRTRPKSLIFRDWKVPTVEEENNLLARAATGDLAARNELVERNIPAMIRYAIRYRRDHSEAYDLEIDELVAVCAIGMISAIRLYDPAKSRGRLLAFAKWRFRHELGAAVHEYLSFKVPESTRRLHRLGLLNTARRSKTAAAIEAFREVGRVGDLSRVLDHRGLSPESTAELHEMETGVAG